MCCRSVSRVRDIAEEVLTSPATAVGMVAADVQRGEPTVVADCGHGGSWRGDRCLW